MHLRQKNAKDFRGISSRKPRQEVRQLSIHQKGADWSTFFLKFLHALLHMFLKLYEHM